MPKGTTPFTVTIHQLYSTISATLENSPGAGPVRWSGCLFCAQSLSLVPHRNYYHNPRLLCSYCNVPCLSHLQTDTYVRRSLQLQSISQIHFRRHISLTSKPIPIPTRLCVIGVGGTPKTISVDLFPDHCCLKERRLPRCHRIED